MIHRDTFSHSISISLSQVELYAFDEQNPSLRGKSYAVISVDHNPSAPVFTATGVYRETISEFFPSGNTVLTVQAFDSDNDTVSRDSIVSIISLSFWK